jgi:hypothetical protein
VLGLEDLGGLDTLPGGGDLDEDAVLGDTNLLVELRARQSPPTIQLICQGCKTIP